MLKSLVSRLLVALFLFGNAAALQAAEVVLRLHQMLPPQATIPSEVLEPWARKVEKESEGRIAVQLYPSMQLGGRPADLVDQVRDGVVDISWTLFGYTPGRFPKTEVFELPFMMTSATATSMAFQAYYEQYMANNLPGIHVLAVHTHGPGVLHTRNQAVESLEDLQGMKIRGTSRVINEMLSSLGAGPVGMPVSAAPEALSKGVIDGTVMPFEVTTALKIAELAPYHTEFAGKHGLYTGTFLFGMNEARYQSLPDDLKQVIDNNSGMALAKKFGQVMDAGDTTGREAADKAGNTTVTLDASETERWHQASDAVTAEWIEEMDAQGMNGQQLHDAAQALIEKYDAMM